MTTQDPHTLSPTVSAEKAFPGVTGFGATYQLEQDRWVLYAMPGVVPFVAIERYDKPRLDWVMATLRAGLVPTPTEGSR